MSCRIYSLRYFRFRPGFGLKMRILLYSLLLLTVPSTLLASPKVSSIRFHSFIEKFYNDRFSAPAGIFVDRANKEVYVADKGKGEVFVFDNDGSPVFRIGRTSGVASPLDVAVKGNRVYISQDGKDGIGIFSYRGELLGEARPGKDITFSPGKITVDEGGRVYAVNKAGANCLVLDKEDRFAGLVGEGLKSLTDVAVGKDRIFLLTPFDSHAIQVYDKEGRFLSGFEGLDGQGGTLGLPIAAKVDRYGLLWILDSIKGIVVYDEDYKAIARFGDFGAGKGQFLFPVDIDIDGQDMLYVVEKEGKKVNLFKIER